MKKIKALVIAIIAALCAALAIVNVGNATVRKRKKQLKKDIKSNDEEIKDVQSRQDEVVRRKDTITKEIKKGLEDINEAKQNKPKVKKESASSAAKSIKDRLK